MMHTTVALIALLACSCAASRLRSQKPGSLKTNGSNVALVKTSVDTYKKDCGQKRAFVHSQSLAQKETNPGAGINDFTPYEIVEKDGYALHACVLDKMLVHGDKFGKNKLHYTMGGISNVSIVHYSSHVGKDHRQAMSHRVCFEFCRTVPDMLFFGITNGNDCYCAPYYSAMESDSSSCDMTCVGEPTLMCGSKTKSSIFSMHFCDTTGKDLNNAISEADSVTKTLKALVRQVSRLSGKMDDAAESGQTNFGKAGDTAASDLLMTAKTFAGEMEHAAEDANVIVEKLKELTREANKSSKKMDFSNPEDVTKAEHLIENINAALTEGRANIKNLEQNFLHAAFPELPNDVGAGEQYYPIMYFVDKKFREVPTTCSGEPVGKPIVGRSREQCAQACDAQPHSCVGFTFFGGGDVNRLCFLFSRFTSAVYYAGCASKEPSDVSRSAPSSGPPKKGPPKKGPPKKGPPKKMLLLETPGVKTAAKCVAKLADFEGTSLKPQEDGQCKHCLKKLTKSDQCVGRFDGDGEKA